MNLLQSVYLFYYSHYLYRIKCKPMTLAKNQLFKNRFGIAAGAIGAMVVMGIMEVIIDKNFPHPPYNMKDTAATEAIIRNLPASFFFAMLANYAVASLLGGIIASLVSGRQSNNPAFITGLLLMLAGLVNLITIYHPLWFSIISTLLYIPFAYLGFILVKRKAPVPNDQPA